MAVRPGPVQSSRDEGLGIHASGEAHGGSVGDEEKECPAQIARQRAKPGDFQSADFRDKGQKPNAKRAG